MIILIKRICLVCRKELNENQDCTHTMNQRIKAVCKKDKSHTQELS